MIIKHTEQRTTEVEVVDDVVCNGCGKSCRGSMNTNGLVEATVSGAYDGTVIPDGTSWTFSICETCLGKLFSGFVVPPAGHSEFSDDPYGRWLDGVYRWDLPEMAALAPTDTD